MVINYPVYQTGITLNEMPNYISFYIQLANCKIKCKDCHSKELWDEVKGESLDSIAQNLLFAKNQGVDMCIIFGDINNGISSNNLNIIVNRLYKIVPICIYSGASTVYGSLGEKNNCILSSLSYLKLGGYNELFGGLDKITTNQAMYDVKNGFKNITRDMFKVR